MTKTMSDYRIRAQYPEMKEFFEWEGWPGGLSLVNRWRIGEIVWHLRESGPVEHKGNATKVLREQMAADDRVLAVTDMNTQQWSNLLGEMAGLPSTSARKYQWRPALIMRKVDGTRTKRLESNPAAHLPPNPMPLHAEHLVKSREAAAKREARQSAQGIAEDDPSGDPRPEPGADKAKLDVLLGRAPVPLTKASPVPPVAPPVEPTRVALRFPDAPAPAPVMAAPTFVNDDATVVVPRERAVLDVDDVVAADLDGVLSDHAATVAPDPEPFLVSPPPMGLVDQLVQTGGRSLVDNARLLLSLASDMLCQAVVAEASESAELGLVDEQVKDRLGQALDEAQRLRKRLQVAEQQRAQHEAYARRTEAALRVERERGDVLEGNLQRVLKGEKAENTAALRGAQKFLAEKPRVPVS